MPTIRMTQASLLSTLVLSVVCVAGTVPVTEPESVGMSSVQLDRLTEHLERIVDEGQASGFQVLVARHGEVVMQRNVGMADIEANRPVTDETLYRIASMTKPVVGVAMMMLYEEGYYSLQDPVAMHIPEFANLKVYDGVDSSGAARLREPARTPTIHDLMQHTAGFTYGIFGDTPVDRQYLESGVLSPAHTQQSFIDALAELPLLFDPGTRFNYSVSVDVQGYLIEKWTGMELADFLRERIFEPLGMDETMDWVPARNAQHLAVAYTHDADGRLVRAPGLLLGAATEKPPRFNGGAQLISTSEDYWRFTQMLLNGGEFNGQRLLSSRSVEMMAQNRLDTVATIPGWFDRQGFGLNFAVITDDSRADYPASEGEYFWSGALTTVFWIDPSQDLIAILMTQYTPFLIGEYFDLMHRYVNTAVLE